MSFAFLARVTATPDSIIEYFQERGVLRPKTNPFPCPVENCGKDMAWTKKNSISDGYVWRCRKHSKTISIRAGSYFRKSKLSLKTLFELLFCWAHRMTNDQAGLYFSIVIQGIQDEFMTF